jgi:hypothetical protein
MRYRLQRHDGTDCSATMVPITVLRMVPIQRYRHLSKAKKIFELNKQKEALQIILLSKRISEEDKKTALQYYNQL